MSEEEILKVLEKFADYLNLSSLGSNLLRSIGMAIIKGLVSLVDGLSNVLMETLKFLGFYNSSDLSGGKAGNGMLLLNSGEGSLFHTLAPFQKFGLAVGLILVVGVLFLGKSEETREIPRNFMSIVIIIGLLPSIMTNGIKIMTGVTTDIQTTQGSLGLATVKENVIDVYGFVNDEWQSTQLKENNQLVDLVGFDVNEIVLENDADPTGVLNNKVIYKPYSSEKMLEPLAEKSNALLVADLINSMLIRYYRWDISWLNIFVTLIAFLVSLVLSILRSARLGMEIAVNYFFTQVIAFFSLTSTARLKQAVMAIITGFVTMLTIFMMYYMFLYYIPFVKEITTNPWAQLAGIIGGCWLLYDGPAIVQQLFGVDAGLGTAGAIATAYGLGSLGKLKNVAGSAVSNAAGVGGFLSGFGKRNKENNEEDSSKLERGQKNDDSSVEKSEEQDSQENGQEQAQNQRPIQEQLDSEGDRTASDGKNSGSRIADSTDSLEATAGTEGDSESVESTDSLETNQDKGERTESRLPETDSVEPPITDTTDTTTMINAEETDNVPKSNSEETKNESRLPEENHSKPDNNATEGMKADSPEIPKEESVNQGMEKESTSKLSETEPSNPSSTVQSKRDKATKPVNPMRNALDQKLSTPKQYEEKGSMVRNSYSKAKSGAQLGKDFSDYLHDRKKFKEQKAKEKSESKEEKNRRG